MLEVMDNQEIAPLSDFAQSIEIFEEKLKSMQDDVEKYLETISLKEHGTSDQGYRFD